MLLRINRKKYSGETKIECFAAFMHQQFVRSKDIDGKDIDVISKIYERAIKYIDKHYATADESAEEVFKYCTDELLLKCFESIIKDDPVKYKNVRFEN